MKKRIGKKICISIFVMLVFVALFYTKSYAKELKSMKDLMSERNIGNTIHLIRGGEPSGNRRLLWNPNLYCYQHEKSFEESTYTVQAYIEIDGDKATRYFYNDNNNSKTVTNNTSIGLGFIFEHGTFGKGYRW